MFGMIRQRLTYANVVATIALFVALGGTTYAAATGSIDGREIKDNTIRSKDIRNNAIRGGDIRRGAVQSSDVKDASLLSTDFKGRELPAGPKGATGPRGLPGSAGSARAYAFVSPTGCGMAVGSSCSFSQSKGVTSVKRIEVGAFCITAPGLSPTQLPAFTSVDYYNNIDYTVSALTDERPTQCAPNGFRVDTFYVPHDASRSPQDVAFTFMVP